MEVVAYPFLALILLAAQGNHDLIASCRGGLFDACQDGREIIVGELGYDDAYQALGHHTAMAESLTDGVGKEIMLTGILLDSLATLFADAR